VSGLGEFLDHWWNLPFLVELGLVAVFFVLQIVGIVGHAADLDVDHDMDADVDHDVEVEADAGLGWHDALAFFGVGRVPFMVVWVTLFLFGGLTGIFVNGYLYADAAGRYPPWGFAVSLASSLAAGLVAVRLFSRVAARLVDTGTKGASAKHELTGKIGVVASPKADAKFAEIRVHDDRGNEILVHGRLADGARELAHGTEVILLDYDSKRELFLLGDGDELMTHRKENG
jgi:membrane protein implicated in regulation of membrane protease activity